MKNRKFLVRVVFYIIGMFVLALGLTLNAKSNLGLAPVISLPYTVSQIFGWDFGNTVFASYVVYVVIELLLAGKESKWLILLQLPISLLFTRLMNGMNLLFDMQVSGMAMQLLLLVAAIVFTGIGAAMTLATKLVPNPVDGIVYVVAAFFRKKTGFTKNIFDLVHAAASFCLGWIVGAPLLGVGIGTIVCVLGVGRVIAGFNRYWKPFLQRQSGILEETAPAMENAYGMHNSAEPEIEIAEDI